MQKVSVVRAVHVIEAMPLLLTNERTNQRIQEDKVLHFSGKEPFRKKNQIDFPQKKGDIFFSQKTNG